MSGYPSDNLADVLTSLGTDAGTASTALGTISAGSDVLVSNFAGLKLLVDDLSALATVLKAQTFYVPVGGVIPFAGDTASVLPNGWLLCNGQSGLATTGTYADLFSVIGYSYGGSGSVFSLPDLRGRTVIGVGTGTELTAALGVTPAGMAASVTLTSAQSGVPAHSHSITDVAHGHTNRASSGTYTVVDGSDGFIRSHNIQDGGFANTNANYTGITGTNNNTAANAASSHTNIQPSLPLNYIIKV